jgi:hypothetical protein
LKLTSHRSITTKSKKKALLYFDNKNKINSLSRHEDLLYAYQKEIRKMSKAVKSSAVEFNVSKKNNKK